MLQSCFGIRMKILDMAKRQVANLLVSREGVMANWVITVAVSISYQDNGAQICERK